MFPSRALPQRTKHNLHKTFMLLSIQGKVLFRPNSDTTWKRAGNVLQRSNGEFVGAQYEP